MANRWKIATIIFVIILILETLLIVWAYYNGRASIKNEEDCMLITCKNYSAYNYDLYFDICYCFENNEVVYTEKYE